MHKEDNMGKYKNLWDLILDVALGIRDTDKERKKDSPSFFSILPLKWQLNCHGEGIDKAKGETA